MPFFLQPIKTPFLYTVLTAFLLCSVLLSVGEAASLHKLSARYSYKWLSSFSDSVHDSDYNSNINAISVLYDRTYGIELSSIDYGIYEKIIESDNGSDLIVAHLRGYGLDFLLRPFAYFSRTLSIQPELKLGIYQTQNDYPTSNLAEPIVPSDYLLHYAFALEVQLASFDSFALHSRLEFGIIEGHEFIGNDNYLAFGFSFESPPDTRMVLSELLLKDKHSFLEDHAPKVEPVYEHPEAQYNIYRSKVQKDGGLHVLPTGLNNKEAYAVANGLYRPIFECDAGQHFGQVGVFNRRLFGYEQALRYLNFNSVPYKIYTETQKNGTELKIIIIGTFSAKKELEFWLNKIERDLNRTGTFDYCELYRKAR